MRGSYFCAQPELAYTSSASSSISARKSSSNNASSDGRGTNDTAGKSNVDANANANADANGTDKDDNLSMFFRATYASAPFDRILEGIGRFGDAVREEFGLKIED